MVQVRSQGRGKGSLILPGMMRRTRRVGSTAPPRGRWGWGDRCTGRPVQVRRVEYTTNGQGCVGECGQQGEDYWWCYKSPRSTTTTTTTTTSTTIIHHHTSHQATMQILSSFQTMKFSVCFTGL